MFVVAIFVVVFGLFVLAVYGSKRFIDENAGDNSLIRVVRTYKVNDKEYWLRLEIVLSLYFIILGSAIGVQIILNPPSDSWAMLMGTVAIFMMLGLGGVVLYGNYKYRALTKNRPVTFDPETKSVIVTENDEEIKFQVTDIEIMTCFIVEGN